MASSSKRRLLSCSGNGDSVTGGMGVEQRGPPLPSPAPAPTHRLELLLGCLGQLREVQAGGCGQGGDTTWGLFLARSHQNGPQLHPTMTGTSPPKAQRASLSKAGQAQGVEVAGGERDPPPRVAPRCQAGPSSQGCSGGPVPAARGGPQSREPSGQYLCAMHFGRTLRSGEGSGGKNRIKVDVKRAGTRTPPTPPSPGMLQCWSQGCDQGPPLGPVGTPGGT